MTRSLSGVPLQLSPRRIELLLIMFKAIREKPFPSGGLVRGLPQAAATLTELPRVRTIHYGLTKAIIGCIPSATIPYQEPRRASSSSGNSDRVAFSQPRVAGEDRYPGLAPPLTLLLCKSCD